LLQRLLHGGNLVVEAITPMGAVLLLIAVAASLRDRFQRWVVGIFVVPLGLIWAVAFSYDLRNLALIVPWVGSAAGIGLMEIASGAAVLYRSRSRGTRAARTRNASEGTSWRPRWRFGSVPFAAAHAIVGDGREKIVGNQQRRRETVSQPGFLRVGHVVGVGALLLIAFCLCFRDETLIRFQHRQQRSVGLPELNCQLYAYAADHPGEATIATDYQAMRWLPELGRRSVVCTCHEFSAFRQTFDRPEVHFVLVRTLDAAAEVRSFLAGQTAARLIFENHGFAFYEKRPGDPAKVAAVR
jgi:hypothetical protein